jgi:hypothetical protein
MDKTALAFASLAALASATALGVAKAGHAAVLCEKQTGAVFVRSDCKKKETKLDPVALGLVGPKGDPGTPAPASTWPLTSCPPDSVIVGTSCVDTYEASVWQIPPSNAALVAKVQAGTVTLADLTAAGAVELSATIGASCGPNFPSDFPASGDWTPLPGSSPPSPGVYAVSIAGVPPTACITWFQANEACRLSGKRLLRNDEWQAAAQGTPDPGTDDGTTNCAVNSPGPVNTGSRSNCRSSRGVFDMVGNVEEWVADWADLATNTCTDWTTSAGITGLDASCFGGTGGGGSASLPGAFFRGGHWSDGAFAGVFAARADVAPSFSIGSFGFRCAR